MRLKVKHHPLGNSLVSHLEMKAKVNKVKEEIEQVKVKVKHNTGANMLVSLLANH